jgi:regulator of protease activity HflC (stomatin/prohibitin superfamily)
MMATYVYLLPLFIFLTLTLLALSIKILREYEQAAVFTLGRFDKVKGAASAKTDGAGVRPTTALPESPGLIS